jgi:hypothetical protein
MKNLKIIPALLLAVTLTAHAQVEVNPVLSNAVGQDSDSNLVRDDVDNFINSLPDQPLQKAALKQLSVMINFAMTVDATQAQSVQLMVNKLNGAYMCLDARYGPVALDKRVGIEKIVLNTKARFLAYENFKAAALNVTPVLPKAPGCENI